jgi:capsular polysaccharide transport system permease protein
MHQIIERPDRNPMALARRIVPAVVDRLRSLPLWPQEGKRVYWLLRPYQRVGTHGWGFLVCVILPTIITLVYLSVFAVNQYQSEAVIVVRTASANDSSVQNDSLSLLSSGGGAPKTSTQDSYIVGDYVRSRSILEDLGGAQWLYKIYSAPQIDWFSRLRQPSTFENVLKYWNAMVTANIETISGIVTIDVRAFTAEDARRLDQLIVQHSEELVNELSERSRKAAMALAESEVDRARQQLTKAQEHVLVFRNTANLIDPMTSAGSIGDTITQLMQDRIALEDNRASLSGMTISDSPTRQVIDAQIDAISAQIANLQKKLTDEKTTTAISAKISEYEDLELQAKFAEKMYSTAEDSYEQARKSLEKQQMYLATIVRPTMPEEPYPRVITDTIVAFALGLALWSMGSLMLAAIRDHMI